MNIICEACESLPADSEESADGGQPYRVCSACHERLIARALRPLEWFNLAKRHGWWKFLLHDDFYEEDGTACQPECEVDDPGSYPSPTFNDVKGDPELLLDFTITRWSFTQDLVESWQALSRDEVQRSLCDRYSANTDKNIRGCILDVAACSLDDHGRDFVSEAWEDYTDPDQLGSFAYASASCLEFDDGFSRVVRALSVMDEKARREKMYALHFFHSPKTLDWIESNISSPVTENWGRLAAASCFDWDRAVAWVNSGRLLSLVALDALAAIVRPQSPLLRDYGPRLLDKPNRASLQRLLDEYMERDSAPRVKMTVRFLLEHSEVLTE